MDEGWNGGVIVNGQSEYLVAIYEGVVQAPVTGSYTFYLYHDDGSDL